MGNAVFQVTGPGGEGEVVAESLWELAVFELPPQSVPGTYTVTEKSSAVEPFTIEFFAVDP
ncbi:MAG TPA: hypothetical protein VD902_02885, partial [Symbiobacteriaceae bacterium]|nr:hypothetical protein [Symbiobacteriaceae bacterium]